MSKLPEPIQEQILTFPEYRMGAHKVDLILRDGRVVHDVIVAWGEEIIRIDGDPAPDFDGLDVVDVRASD